jgi:hypothetical protein
MATAELKAVHAMVAELKEQCAALAELFGLWVAEDAFAVCPPRPRSWRLTGGGAIFVIKAGLVLKTPGILCADPPAIESPE